MLHPDFWENHYKKFGVTEPSSFAKFCADRWINPIDIVVEIGCGNGRDGEFLATRCAKYYAIDSSASAIRSFSDRVSLSDYKSIFNFFCGDVLDFKFSELTAPTGGKIVVYSRFSLHSVDEATENYILHEFAQLSQERILAVEARTILDPLYGVGIKVSRNAFETDHYRRFIDPRDFLDFSMDQAEIQYFALSDGVAVTETENPVVMRAIVRGRNL
jgi:SAM-dependent methyltransferase